MKRNTDTNTKHCAQHIERLLRIPGIRRACDLGSQAPSVKPMPCLLGFGDTSVKGIQNCLEPLHQVHRAVSQVHHPDLRCFAQAVMAEPDVLQAITTATNSTQRAPIERIRRASRIAQQSSWLSRQERDVLHVGVLLAGLREVLAHEQASPLCTASDVLFAIVCKDLHHLQEKQPAIANMVRMALGWGQEDELESEYSQWLKNAIERSLEAVGMLEPADMGQ